MEQKEYKFIDICPICGSKHSKTELELNDYFLTKEKFFINECKNCGFRYTNPQPFESQMGRYYDSKEYISHNSAKKSLVGFLYRFVRSFSIKGKYKVIKKRIHSGRILDYGCGEGEFLNYCKKQGWNCVGVEINENARKIALEKGLKVETPERFYSFEEEQFDVITLWHVLEHVYDLNKFIEQAKKSLKRDGFAVIALPNFNSYDAQYYKKYWAAYDVPRHLWHFSQQNIETFMLDHGFKMVEKIGMKYDSFYVSILSEKYKNKTNLINSFLVGLTSNMKAEKASVGYSSQIYVFKK